MLDRLLDISNNFGVDTLLLLPVLIALEAVLSADNAIALAAIAQGLESEKQQQRALNVGLVAAFLLRMLLILTASWVLQYWQFEVAGAAYLSVVDGISAFLRRRRCQPPSPRSAI